MYIQTSMLPHSISHAKLYWDAVIVPLQVFYPHEPASIALQNCGLKKDGNRSWTLTQDAWTADSHLNTSFTRHSLLETPPKPCGDMSIVNAPTFIPTPWKGLPLIPEVVRVDDVCLARLMNDFRVGTCTVFTITKSSSSKGLWNRSVSVGVQHANNALIFI